MIGCHGLLQRLRFQNPKGARTAYILARKYTFYGDYFEAKVYEHTISESSNPKPLNLSHARWYLPVCFSSLFLSEEGVGVGGGVATTMFRKPTQNPAIYYVSVHTILDNMLQPAGGCLMLSNTMRGHKCHKFIAVSPLHTVCKMLREDA